MQLIQAMNFNICPDIKFSVELWSFSSKSDFHVEMCLKDLRSDKLQTISVSPINFSGDFNGTWSNISFLQFFSLYTLEWKRVNPTSKTLILGKIKKLHKKNSLKNPFLTINN